MSGWRKRQVMEMALEAGVRDDEHRFEFSEYKYLERFAELVRNEEREACAKVCEDSVEYAGDTLAQAIRARGQT
tara:strand:- start:123 stop:344 length:222 start_codon:yes stop_codon:yes gene_type:complete